jgi:membrane protein YdbS with pleckstrin-like domain
VSSKAAACPQCGYGLASATGAPGSERLSVAASVPAAEQTLWESSPSLRLLLGQLLTMLLVVLAVGLFAVVLLPAIADVARNSWLDVQKAPFILGVVVGVYLVFRGVLLGLRAARLRATRYKLTNQRLVVETGLVSRTLSDVDLRSVEDLIFRQGPMERLLGIGTIGVVSSDRNTPRLQLVGVKDPKATRELIRSQAYALTQRQLFTRST